MLIFGDNNYLVTEASNVQEPDSFWITRHVEVYQ